MEERDKKKNPKKKKNFPSAQCESGNDLDYDVDIIIQLSSLKTYFKSHQGKVSVLCHYLSETNVFIKTFTSHASSIYFLKLCQLHKIHCKHELLDFTRTLREGQVSNKNAMVKRIWVSN